MSTDTIGTGKDHATHVAWYAAIPTTLLEAEVGLTANETFDLTSELVFDGKTTTGSLTIELKPDTGASFVDSKDDVGFVLNINESQGCVIAVPGSGYVDVMTISDNNWTLREMQIYGEHNDSKEPLTINSAGASILVVDSIIRSDGGGTNTPITVNNSTANFVNCLIINAANGTVRELNLKYTATILTNCTVIIPSDNTPAGTGIHSDAGAAKALNCAVFGFVGVTAMSSSMATGTDYNATDDNAIVGSNSLVDQTYADCFVVTTAASSDFQLKSGSPLIGTGNTDASWPNDILGRVRGTTTTGDIGCHEFVSAGGPSFIAREGLLINRAVQRASTI